MNVILGGGLIALLAKDILGGKWTVVPVGRSRFYSFKPPLAPNFIIWDKDIAFYLDRWTALPILHRAAYSYAGQLLFDTHLSLRPYLAKVYGERIPSHAEAYWASRTEFTGCGDCSHIYESLHAKYKDELFANQERYGKPLRIEDHVVHTERGQLPYERIVSTVPLYALLKWLGVELELPSRDQYYYHIQTDCLNFEGATVVMVVDHEIRFHRVLRINQHNYIVQSIERINQPGQYFLQFMERFELLAETSVERAICLGDIPRVSELERANISCVGSAAVWDDCLDVGSCIKRLLKLESS